MHPKMMATLSNFPFTPFTLATAKLEPKSSVTNQSVVIADPRYEHDQKNRTLQRLNQRLNMFAIRIPIAFVKLSFE
jgi:hypothetical protein